MAVEPPCIESLYACIESLYACIESLYAYRDAHMMYIRIIIHAYTHIRIRAYRFIYKGVQRRISVHRQKSFVYTYAHIDLRASDDAHHTKESYISAQKMVMGPGCLCVCHVCVCIYVCIHRSTKENISALTMIIEPLCIEAILCVCMHE